MDFSLQLSSSIQGSEILHGLTLTFERPRFCLLLPVYVPWLRYYVWGDRQHAGTTLQSNRCVRDEGFTVQSEVCTCYLENKSMLNEDGIHSSSAQIAAVGQTKLGHEPVNPRVVSKYCHDVITVLEFRKQCERIPSKQSPAYTKLSFLWRCSMKQG